MPPLQYQKNCRNITKIDLALIEYGDKKALIDKQFNDEVDLLRQNIASHLCSLRTQRDEQLAVAWTNYVALVTPFLSEKDLSLLVELGALPSL